MTDVVGGRSSTTATTVWVSHLTDAELAALRPAYPDFTFRPRIGTDLWLGDRDALQVTATVLDVHAVERGDVFGYRGRTAPKAGHLLVVSGGTAHGIGLEAPTGDAVAQGPRGHRSPAAAWTRPGSCGRRTPSTASSGCSPSRRTCRPRCCSCPRGARVPEVGDEIDVRVRYTATTFDRDRRSAELASLAHRVVARAADVADHDARRGRARRASARTIASQ